MLTPNIPGVFGTPNQHNSSLTLKSILCEVPFFGGLALLLSYSVGAMASCNYIRQINNVF